MKSRIFAAMLKLSGGEVPHHDAIAAAIVDSATREQLPPLLLVALAHHESRFRVGAVNMRTKCAGLFQTSPYWSRPGRIELTYRLAGGAVAREVALGAAVLRHYYERGLPGMDVFRSWERTLGAWHARAYKPTRWSRAVVRTWRMLERG